MSDEEAAYRRAQTALLGHQAVGVGAIGIRAGLLAAVRERGPLTAGELAEALEADDHLVRVWCRAAFAVELLELDAAGRYRLAPGAATVLLDETHPAYLGGYDLVLMNRSLHEVGGPTEQADVLQRSRRALRPGGWVVASELPYPDDEDDYRTDPDSRRLAGVQLHEAIVGCSMITRSQLVELLGGAGLVDVRLVDQPRSSRMVGVGRRPA